MSIEIIRKGLETAANAWAVAQGMEIVFEDENFTPGDATYARSFLLPLPPESDTLDKIHRVYEGVYQISIFTPAGAGPRAAEAFLASLDAAFSPAAPMVVDGLRIFITRPMGARTAGQDTDWRSLPVSCAYRADTV